MYPGRHRFELGNSASGGCRAAIEIPLTREAARPSPAERVAPVAPLRVVSAETTADSPEPETDFEPARRRSDA
jgi:hypothetical protein